MTSRSELARRMRELLFNRNDSYVEIGLVEEVKILPSKNAVLLEVEVVPAGWKATVRLLVPYLGMGHAAVAVPRPGDEVVCLFPGGDINMGYGFWGPFNGVDKVPEDAAEDRILIDGRPGDNLKVHIRSYSDVRIDDTEKTDIGKSSDLTVGTDRTETIGANRSETVGADQATAIGGNESNSVAGDQSEDVTGNATRNVGGNQTEVVVGQVHTTAGPMWQLDVAGPVIINAAGPVSVNCAGAFAVTDGGAPIISYASVPPSPFPLNIYPPTKFHNGTEGDRV